MKYISIEQHNEIMAEYKQKILNIIGEVAPEDVSEVLKATIRGLDNDNNR